MASSHIVAIVAIVFITVYLMFEQYTKMKSKGAMSKKEVDALKAEVNELKHRLATVEKIVTDSSYDLKRQIDSL